MSEVRHVSLKDVRNQRKFEKEEGIDVKCFLFDGQYLGTYTIRPNREAARDRYSALEKQWRREHNKARDYPLSDEQKEPLLVEALIEHVGAFRDFLDDDGKEIPPLLDDGKTLNRLGLLGLLRSDPVYVTPITKMLGEEDAFNVERLKKLQGNS
jgi:hypothetical protein